MLYQHPDPPFYIHMAASLKPVILTISYSSECGIVLRQDARWQDFIVEPVMGIVQARPAIVRRACPALNALLKCRVTQEKHAHV
jgi:hypothetical protein